jgi:hypothetical protein
MVALRSTRQDRTLLIVLWAFTAIVLTLGGLAVSPILLVWGVVGLLAAIYLTRIHIRDTRASAAGGASGGPASTAAHHAGEPVESTSEKDAEESR